MLVMGDVNAATCRKLFEDQFTLSTTVNDTSAVVDLSVSVRTYISTCMLMRRKQLSRFFTSRICGFSSPLLCWISFGGHSPNITWAPSIAWASMLPKIASNKNIAFFHVK